MLLFAPDFFFLDHIHSSRDPSLTYLVELNQNFLRNMIFAEILTKDTTTITSNVSGAK